jgi:hypothetical protein
LSVLLLLLQAAVPLVHHTGVNESCIAGSTSFAATVESAAAAALDRGDATPGQRSGGHDPLHCLFCRSISRTDGNGLAVTSVTLVVGQASNPLSVTGHEVAHGHDASAEIPARAPPVSA